MILSAANGNKQIVSKIDKLDTISIHWDKRKHQKSTQYPLQASSWQSDFVLS